MLDNERVIPDETERSAVKIWDRMEQVKTNKSATLEQAESKRIIYN